MNRIIKVVLVCVIHVILNFYEDLFNDVIKKLPQSKYLIRIKKKDRKKHYFGIESTLVANFPL
jgi:hypothetical protein